MVVSSPTGMSELFVRSLALIQVVTAGQAEDARSISEDVETKAVQDDKING